MSSIIHALCALEAIDGAAAGAIVDADAALCLATFGERSVDVETEAALHAQMFALRTAREYPLTQRTDVELIVVHFTAHVHLVAATRGPDPLLAFVAIRRDDSNLALAMRAVRAIVATLERELDTERARARREPAINAIAS